MASSSKLLDIGTKDQFKHSPTVLVLVDFINSMRFPELRIFCQRH